MLKKFLLSLSNKNSFFATAKRIYQKVRKQYYDALPIDKKLIIFEAFQSTKYGDSPKAIYEYMLNHDDFKSYHFIWLLKHPEKYKFLENKRTKVVKHDSRAYYMAFARAKYWVVNGWLPLRVQKKKGQVVLQCWHGTPLKRLRHDIKGGIQTNHKKNLSKSDQDILRYDYFITTSKYNTKVTLSAFDLKNLGKEDVIIETGYPRNDALVNSTEDDRRNYRKKFKVPDDKKAILYAPTWRDDMYVENKGYEYTSPVNFEYLQKELGDEYIILFRAHNFITNQLDFSKYRDFVYDVSQVDDVNELFIVSDILITDYSSILFDYANLSRPMIFYMYDLEYYQNDLRGFYLEPNLLPGDVVKTEKEVVGILHAIDAYNDRVQKEYKDFHRTYNYLDDGHATKRVVERVFYPLDEA